MIQFLMMLDWLQPHLCFGEPVSEDTQKIYRGLWSKANKQPKLMMRCIRECTEEDTDEY